MEPFCSLGGTGRAGTRYGSIKLGLAFVNVSGLKASTGRMGPGNKHQTEVNSEGVLKRPVTVKILEQEDYARVLKAIIILSHSRHETTQHTKSLLTILQLRIGSEIPHHDFTRLQLS